MRVLAAEDEVVGYGQIEHAIGKQMRVGNAGLAANLLRLLPVLHWWSGALAGKVRIGKSSGRLAGLVIKRRFRLDDAPGIGQGMVHVVTFGFYLQLVSSQQIVGRHTIVIAQQPLESATARGRGLDGHVQGIAP